MENIKYREDGMQDEPQRELSDEEKIKSVMIDSIIGNVTFNEMNYILENFAIGKAEEDYPKLPDEVKRRLLALANGEKPSGIITPNKTIITP